MRNAAEKPVYLKLVETLHSGFSVLDLSVQNEIKQFVAGQQHKSGGFMDRAGNPDLYYSLFGLWLSIATGQTKLHKQLRNYVVNTKVGDSKSGVEDLAMVLIKSYLEPDIPGQSLFSILLNLWKKGRLMDLSYRFFLVSLAVDAIGKNRKLYYFLARIGLSLYKPKGNIPCSVGAAMLYARELLGLRTQKNKKELAEFLSEGSGFRAFRSIDSADSLSTGVALFALKESGEDIRLMRPGCLAFIQDNYSEGAFLSGDGDLTKDLEYTFYGLLALGALLQNEG